MERHFILPITVAAAIHAGLLFGFRSPRLEASAPGKHEAPAEFTRLIIPFLLADPEPIDSAEESAAPISSPDQQRPTLPEPIPVDFSPGPKINPPIVPIRTVVGLVTEIPPMDFGRPDGTNRGIGSGGAVPSGWLDHEPRARYQAPPQFPPNARRDGRDGEVLVEFVVDERGNVVAPRVVSSSDHMFDEATLRAVAKWRFEPGRRNGQLVRFRMAVPVRFSLNAD